MVLAEAAYRGAPAADAMRPVASYHDVSLGPSSMDKETIRKAVRLLGAQGGKAAERMTKAERVAQARKVADASAKARSKKATQGE